MNDLYEKGVDYWPLAMKYVRGTLFGACTGHASSLRPMDPQAQWALGTLVLSYARRKMAFPLELVVTCSATSFKLHGSVGPRPTGPHKDARCLLSRCIYLSRLSALRLVRSSGSVV